MQSELHASACMDNNTLKKNLTKLSAVIFKRDILYPSFIKINFASSCNFWYTKSTLELLRGSNSISLSTTRLSNPERLPRKELNAVISKIYSKVLAMEKETWRWWQNVGVHDHFKLMHCSEKKAKEKRKQKWNCKIYRGRNSIVIYLYKINYLITNILNRVLIVQKTYVELWKIVHYGKLYLFCSQWSAE